MAALNFPANPTDGQVYTANSQSWVYVAAKTSWVTVNDFVLDQDLGAIAALPDTAGYLKKNGLASWSLDTTVVNTAGSYANPGWITSLAATKLTGTTLPSSIVSSSLTSVGTLAGLSVSGSVSLGFDVFLGRSDESGPYIGASAAVPIRFGANDVELMRITSTGLGIGTNGNPSYKLHVVGTGNITGNTLIGGTLGVTGAITGSLTGNASTATTLQTARSINGVSFNGSADITVTAAAGTLSGTTLNSTVVTSSLTSVGTLSSLTVGGNITLSSTGQRFLADMSNATVANRFAFQTSTSNSQSVVTVLPNGTGTVTQLQMFNNSTPTNASFAGLYAGAGEVRLQSGTQGTGTYLPLTLYTSGNERMRLDTAGNVGIGTTSPSSKLHIVGEAIFGGGSSADVVTLRGRASDGYSLTLFTSSDGATPRGYFGSPAANVLAWFDGSFTERMRLDASGNLGIGTTSPGFKLTTQHTFPTAFTNAAGDYAMMVRSGGTSENWLGVAGQNTTDKWVGLITNGSPAPSLAFGTGGTTQMRLDTAGNLGLGVTPSGWGSGYRALEIGRAGTAFMVGTSAGGLHSMVNSYFNGTTYVYANSSAYAVRYLMAAANGQHQWFTAPSGTAGDVISYTQSMTLDASGNLAVGATSANTRLHVQGNTAMTSFTGTGYGQAIIRGPSAVDRYATLDFSSTGDWPIGRVGMYYTSGGSYLQFGTSNSYASGITNTALTIDPSGNVGVGTVTPGTTFHVNKASQTPGTSTPTGALILTNLAAGDGCIEIGSGATALGYVQVRNRNSATFYDLVLQPSGGNVGIGTTSPTTLLQASLSSSSSGLAIAGGLPTLVLYDSSGTTGMGMLGQLNTDTFLINKESGGLVLGTGNVERARIDAFGNLAVATGNVSIASGSVLYLSGAGGNAYLQETGGTLFLGAGGAGRVQVASTGNVNIDSGTFFVDAVNNRVGVGTTSPNYPLTVIGDIYANGARAFRLADENTAIAATAASNAGLIFYTGTGSEKLRLDSIGNLGLGVTPSAWAVVGPVLQVNTAAFYGYSNQARVASNAYYDGSEFKYIASAYASEYRQTGGQHQWLTAPSGTAGAAISFTQAMTLESDADLGLNVASVTAVGANYTTMHLRGRNTTSGGAIRLDTSDASHIGIAYVGSVGFDIGTSTATPLRFFTGTGFNERARITSGGYFKASDAGTYLSATGSYHELRQSASDWTVTANNTGTTPYGYRVIHTTDANNSGSDFLYCVGSVTLRASIRSNGGIANYSANDVNLSDLRVKKNITPVATYWDKLKAVEVVTFKYNDQTHDDTNVGVIAQQVEAVAPEFVDVDGFGETPEDGVPLKAIYNTDLQFAALRALQEAMARIESLEAQNLSLSSRLAALEA